MNKLLFVTLSLGLALASAPVQAKKGGAPSVGERCQLKRGAVLTKKSNGRGKRTNVAAGATLEVVEVKGGMLLVSEGKRRGYISKKGYLAFCEVVAATPEVATPTPEPTSTVTETATPSAAPTTAAPDAATPTATPTSAAPESIPASAVDAPVAPPPEPTPAAAPTPPMTPGSAAAAFGDTAKIKIAVMDLRGTSDLPKEIVASLTTSISETLEGLGLFKAITSQDIQQVLSFEATRQMLGCDEVSCIAEIGGALGADYLVTGSITQVSDLYVTQLQLTRIADTRVDARVSRDYRGDKPGLFGEVRTAAKILVRDLLNQRSGMVRVAVSEEGATIKIDDAIVGSSPLAPFSVAGGTHTLSVEKHGFVVNKRDFDVTAGAEVKLEVLLFPSAEYVREYRAGARRTRTLAWSAIGGGVVGIGGAAALYVLAGQAAASLNDDIAAYNDDPNRTTADYEKLSDTQKRVALMDVSTLVAGGVGALALGTGILLYVFGDDPSRFDRAATDVDVMSRLELVPLPGGAALGFGGRF